jgi:hypothetical protein
MWYKTCNIKKVLLVASGCSSWGLGCDWLPTRGLVRPDGCNFRLFGRLHEHLGLARAVHEEAWSLAPAMRARAAFPRGLARAVRGEEARVAGRMQAWCLAPLLGLPLPRSCHSPCPHPHHRCWGRNKLGFGTCSRYSVPFSLTLCVRWEKALGLAPLTTYICFSAAASPSSLCIFSSHSQVKKQSSPLLLHSPLVDDWVPRSNPIFIGLVFAAETRSVCPQVVSPLCDQQLTLVLAVLATNLSFSPILLCLWPVMFVF